MRVRACAVPQGALLGRYAARAHVYTDCFEVTLHRSVSLSAVITAFYTTWLFRLERGVLGLALRRPIRDAEVAALARKEADRFAIWTVEARRKDQILLCDGAGRTRSFLGVVPAGPGQTRVVFGSAVLPKGARSLGSGVRLLIPLHRLYARVLLSQAARKLCLDLRDASA